ncbi:MAG: hypothetical protein ACJAYU_002962 [Bradymonadia bacterium]|jgi:hypothetical protein
MRRSVLITLAVGSLALGACGDDEPEPNTDGGTDTPVIDIGDTGAADTATDGGEPVCEDDAPECVRLSDCSDAGFNNPSCVEGCCVEQSVNVDPPCAGHLTECTTAEQTTDDFFCDTDAGQCLQRCDFDSAGDTQSADCPLNSYCLSELTGVEDDALAGICIPGDCESNIFDPESCGGTGTCLAVGNGASYCIDAGTAGEGDTCDTVDENQPASDICQPGALCYSGECTIPCDRRNGDDDCSVEGDECLGVYDTTPRNQPGLCGVSCEAFSRDECGDGVCAPVFGRFAINGWACAPAIEGALEMGANCTAADAECAEGLICITVSEGVQECVQSCDPLGDSELPSAACPGGATGGAVLFEAFSFSDATEYFTAEAGDYPVELRTADGDVFIAGLNVEIDDGSATSVVVTIDVAGAVDAFTLDDFTLEDDLPAQGVRVVHASHRAGIVDVYLDELIAANVQAGDDFVEFALAAGDYGIGYDEFTTLEAGMVYHAKDNGLGAAYEPANIELTVGTLGFRIYHGALGAPAVDVYACEDSLVVPSFLDCDGVEPLATDVLEGTYAPAEGFATAVAADLDGLTVYGVVAGSDPVSSLPEDVAFTWTVTGWTAGALYQVTAYNGDGVDVRADALPLLTEDGEAVVIFQSFGPDPIDATVQAGPIEEAVLYGDSSSGADSAYIELPVGTYGINLLLEDETWSRSPFWEIADGDLATIFAADTADGPTFFATADDFETPEEGMGSTRAVHAADGPEVTVNFPGEADSVCTPSAVDGFGFCQEACSPFPRRVGEYGCEDSSNTCLPFVARDDRPVVPDGYCLEDEGDVGPGGTCTNPGFLGGDCEDFAVCLENEGSDQCLPLCEPFGDSPCAAYDDFSTCSGIPPLVGQLNFSFCVDAQAGNVGDRCTEEGIPCAADHSICLDMGSGPECLGICRAGFDDCGPFEQQCNTGDLNPDVVPTYMGLCR